MSKDWFRHDINARHDPKMVLLRSKHGAEGYGVYWMLVETLRETEGYKFPIKHLPALSLDFAFQPIEAFVSDCVGFDLLCEDGDYFWSDSLLRRMEAYEVLCEKRAEYGRKGGLSKASAKQELSKRGSKKVATRLDKTRLEENREEKKVYAEFVKMTEAEYKKLADQFGVSKTKEMITVLDNYKGSKGKTYKSDYRAILSWVVERCEANKPNSNMPNGWTCPRCGTVITNTGSYCGTCKDFTRG